MLPPNGATPHPEWVRVGATVRALREAWGVTQTELARRAAVDRTMLIRIEAGRRRLLPANARRIASVLNISPIAILSPDHFTDEVAARVQGLRESEDPASVPAAAAEVVA